MQLLQRMHLISIVLIDQIVNFPLCQFHRICTCIYRYFSTNNMLFSYSLSILQKLKFFFWVSHFTPDCGANETVLPDSNKQFLQYKLNRIQLPIYVLFIPIKSFTFQVQFYALCPVLSEVILSFSIKCFIMPRTTLLSGQVELQNGMYFKKELKQV